MTGDPLTLLHHHLETCRTHVEALTGALQDLAAAPLPNLAAPSRAQLRVLDQFAYRFTRLQDDMGARLFADVLRALGEEPSGLPMVDRLARLEQIGWLPDAEAWQHMRRVRNEFVHDYPEEPEQRQARLELAVEAAHALLAVFDSIRSRIEARFGT